MSQHTDCISKSPTYFILLLAKILLLSCSKPSNETSQFSDNAKLEIDTVLVDSQGEALFLNWNLQNASLSTDSKYLYNLNITETSLEKIDLDDLQFVNKIKLEKEGPNGIGNNGRGGIVCLNENLILFNGYPVPIIMTTEGEKTDILKELINQKAQFTQAGMDFLYEKVDPENLQMVYGILMKFPNHGHELGILNLNTSDTSKLDLPELKSLNEFTMIYDDASNYEVYEPLLFLSYLNRNIVIGSNINSDMYVYDLKQEKLSYAKMDHKLTPSRKKQTLPKEVSDPETYFSLYKKVESEIAFGKPVYDPTNDRYIRLSYIKHFEDSHEKGYPRLNSVDSFINIYDSSFKLISEIPLPKTSKIPGSYFVKNGVIWLFENLDDEMGFVRLKIG